MSELLDRCRKYGADVEGTMERFIDDEELYECCLKEFSEDKGFKELESALKKEYQEAFECAHALKGVAGNLGLTPLFGAVSELVESLRASEYSDVKEQHFKVSKEWEHMKEMLLKG